MIRYVLNYSNRTHLVANDFNEVKWMSIENRIKYLAASHVFNCIDEQAPEYFQVFERVNDSHHYNTRHSVKGQMHHQKDLGSKCHLSSKTSPEPVLFSTTQL